MADKIISFQAVNDTAFINGIKRLAGATNDFRIPFGLIGNDWYKSNKLIFDLKGPGLYHPLGGFNGSTKGAS